MAPNLTMRSARQSFLFYLIAFIVSFSLMALEIVAGRLIAPYLGVSIYTWTSVIGIVLAGIAAGNFFGGWIADTWHPQQVLVWTLAAAGGSSIVSLFLLSGLGTFLNRHAVSLIAASLGLAGAAFFLPSFFLGMVTPLLIKLALHTLEETGRIAGWIYGTGAVGSVAGVFVTGFFLITYVGTRQIVVSVSVLLVLLSGAIFVWRRARPPLLLLFVVGAVGIASFFAPAVPCEKESQYYCIQFIPAGDGVSVMLRLDHFTHNHIYLDDPKHLGDSYQQVFGLLSSYASRKYDPRRTMLIVGGGGYILPRFLQKYAPDISLNTVEIDPEVTRAVEGLVGTFTFPVVNTDGRVYVERLSDRTRYDVVFVDVFQDVSVPYHLVTKEFMETVLRHLTDRGIYAVNVVDRPDGDFLASEVKTMQEVFPQVRVFTQAPQAGETMINKTHIVLGTRDAFDEALWNAVKAQLPPGDRDIAWSPSRETVATYLRQGRILTDDYVPVEHMLASVSRDMQRETSVLNQ